LAELVEANKFSQQSPFELPTEILTLAMLTQDDNIWFKEYWRERIPPYELLNFSRDPYARDARSG
jgi:hypothetical protein